MKSALVLLNLGTPDSTHPDDVGRYLKEFLMDPAVIDVPTALRWLLVNVIIVPKRKYDSAKLYENIWTPEGSPLMTNTAALADAVRSQASADLTVYGMRYGRPSMKDLLVDLRSRGVESIDFIPLYPQYALSSTGTAVDQLRVLLGQMQWAPAVRVLKPFYDHPVFIDQMAQNYLKVAQDFNPEYTLMSYHGLPQRHLTKIHSKCMTTGCCDKPSDRSATCYRYQSYATSRLLAQKLGLREGQWSVSFQSRLGPGWIQPFTDVIFEELAKKGVNRLAVLSPSFVCDCLETLEEIEERGREIFTRAGGSEIRLIPALNANAQWAKAIAQASSDAKLWTNL